MSEKYTIDDSIKQAEILNETEKIPQEYIDYIQESSVSDYIHIIKYLQEQENKNKTRNNITYICTIVAAVFAVLSVILSLIPYII